ncbi:helix-turn-helix domain-containing protein [uncultured Megasphaera sp.]|nr:helix-turn-helix domain-containing protein [uncultured Megasphaera sp.]
MNINLKKLHQDIDTLLIQDLLQQGFTKTQIASILNISRQTLFNKEQKK